MQNFSPLALKLREQFEDDVRTYCKNAKFLTAPYGTKIVFNDFCLNIKRGHLQATFDSGLPKKYQKYSQPRCAFNGH